jgi:hypothetical protein
MLEVFIRTGLGWILRRFNIKVQDRAILHTHYTKEDFDAKTGALIERQEFDHNCLLNEGITALLNLLIGAAETAFSNANAYTGVGDSDAEALPAQTGLQGSNKAYHGMDATYPTVVDQTVTFRSSFGTSEANIDWKEVTIVSASTDAGDNLNRKVQAMGTKTDQMVRVLTTAITIE